MGERFTADHNQPRLEMHNLIEQTVKLWSCKAFEMPKRQTMERKEAGVRLQSLFKELEIKQKQLLKLQQLRDQEESKRKLLKSQTAIKG